MERSEVAIIIPAFNEERTIAQVVKGVLDYGIAIVVDDCSHDNTGKYAKEAGAVVVRHEENKGYDGALNSGFSEAFQRKCSFVITFDADGQHKADLLASYLNLLQNEKVPLVLGVRPQKARWSEEVMGLYFRWRFGIHDILCGMKGYHIELYEKNSGFDHIHSVGTELTLASLKRGYRFTELAVPIAKRQDNPRFGTTLRSNWKITKALARVIWWEIVKKIS